MPDADSNRSRWPTDPVWRLVQTAPFTAAPSWARRLMRREQYVHAVDQLEAGAYGYLSSRTALLHPQGETFDVSMGLGGLATALTNIAGHPDKDFGALVRARRRKWGPPVAPAEKILPFLPATISEDPTEPEAVDAAAEAALHCDMPTDELRAARLRLAERRMAEALLALEEAGLRGDSAHELARLEQVYAQELAGYEAAMMT
jgi:hypothetical protein